MARRPRVGVQMVSDGDLGYQKLSDEFARDRELSDRACRVGVYVFSHRAGWVMTQEQIGEAVNRSATTVRGALRDLAALNYLRSWPERDERGHIIGTAYLVSNERLSDERWLRKMVDAGAPDSAIIAAGGEPAGQGQRESLTADHAVRDSLTATSLHRDSLHRGSAGHKGDQFNQGDQVRKGPPGPPADEADPPPAGGDECERSGQTAIAIDRGVRRRRGAANLARSARSAGAQRVVTAWAAELNRRPPNRVFADLCVEVDALLSENYPDDVIAAALHAWNGAGRSPLALASFAHQAANRTSKPRTTPHHTADSASEASARNFDAFMASQTSPAVHRTALEA